MDEKIVREAIEEIKTEIKKYKDMAKYFKEYNLKDNSDYYKKIASMHKTALEALEKQLPKKVVDKSLVKDNDIVVGAVGRCPCCNENIDDTTNICDCGQKINWSE